MTFSGLPQRNSARSTSPSFYPTRRPLSKRRKKTGRTAEIRGRSVNVTKEYQMLIAPDFAALFAPHPTTISMPGCRAPGSCDQL
jgi:hypothetical protein